MKLACWDGLRVSVDGVIATDESVAVMVIFAPALIWVVPPNVAFTKSVAIPAVEPAVTVTDVPVVPLSLPKEFVSAHT